MSAFSITDRATWPEAMTAEEVAGVLRRKVGGLKEAARKGVLVPAPFQKHPYLWRRSDVVRHIDGSILLKRSA